MAKKGNRVQVILECTEQKESGVAGMSRYTALLPLFGIAIAATVVAAVFQFGAALKDNPANAVKSLLGLVLMVVILFVTWAIGDGTPMNIRGYEGADNVTFWLKITDMFLYTIYILLFVTIVAIIASGIKKKIS